MLGRVRWTRFPLVVRRASQNLTSVEARAVLAGVMMFKSVT